MIAVNTYSSPIDSICDTIGISRISIFIKQVVGATLLLVMILKFLFYNPPK